MKISGEDLNYLRERMVTEQLKGRDISDKQVLGVFRKVQRHRFVDPAMYQDAYGDFPLSIGKGQTISQPYMVALMVQLLRLKKKDRVLEIGTGSGYETAVIAELAGTVFSVERIASLADTARSILKELTYDNIEIKVGDGTSGWEEFAPFDKIIVTASSPSVPVPLLQQLSVSGKMVIPIGSRYSQKLTLLEKTQTDKVLKHEICSCVFVPLIGEYAWRPDDTGDNS